MPEKPHPKSNVTVCVRCRKLLPAEAMAGNTAVVRASRATREVKIGAEKAWKFDEVFDETATQQQVYDSVVKDLVHGCFAGINATVLAYGQTGSGKTYTMGTTARGFLQDPESDGVLPRAVQDIFHHIDELDQETRVAISVSFLEIYNEEIRDLLHPEIEPKDIYLREDGGGIVTAVGVPDEIVTSIEEVMAFVELGTRRRTTAQTLMNDTSSRSHAIFTIQLQLLTPRMSETMPHKEELHVLRSKLQLVDLAGSERQKRTGAQGLRLKESVGINQGLLSLGKVISALTIAKAKSPHVPYRDSKLTRFLQDSLGGNSRTVMIACISPTELSLHETMSTLNYASRASGIENRPTVNLAVASVPDPLRPDVQTEIDELQAEVRRLQQLMASNSAAQGSKGGSTSKAAAQCLSELDNLQVAFSREYGHDPTTAKFAETMNHCKTLVSQILFDDGADSLNGDVQQLEAECKRLTEELNDCRAILEQDEEIFREKIKELKDAKKQNHVLRKELELLRENVSQPPGGHGLSPEQELQLKELRNELHRKELEIRDLTEQQAVQGEQIEEFQKRIKELAAETTGRAAWKHGVPDQTTVRTAQEVVAEVRRLGEAAAQQRSRNDLSTRLASCDLERDRLLQELRDISKAVVSQETELRSCIERSTREMADAKQKLNALGFELREQRAQLGPSHPEVEQLQNQIMELDRHRRILQQTVSDASRKLDTNTYVPAELETRKSRIKELLSDLDGERDHLQLLLAEQNSDTSATNDVDDGGNGLYHPFDARIHPLLRRLGSLPPAEKQQVISTLTNELFTQVRLNHIQQQKISGLKLELAERNNALTQLTEYQQQEAAEFEQHLTTMTETYEAKIQTLCNKLRLAELALYDQATNPAPRGAGLIKPRTADAATRMPSPF